MGLFESHVPIDSITVMVQKEVAERMQASPGTKDYGALTLAVGYYAKPEIVANVPPNCFMPRPKVGSAVIRLKRHEHPIVQVEDEKSRYPKYCPECGEKLEHEGGCVSCRACGYSKCR